jgi:hypothetical protein
MPLVSWHKLILNKFVKIKDETVDDKLSHLFLFNGRNEMVQGLNSNILLTGNANAMMSPVNIQQGRIFYGDRGIEFRANTGGGYIQIPWRNVESVSMEIILNFYYRGFLNLLGAKLNKPLQFSEIIYKLTKY